MVQKMRDPGNEVGTTSLTLPVYCGTTPLTLLVFTAVKRLGTRVNTRGIYALPVTFALHLTKFPRSTSATRAISVLSSIILPLQMFFSRVLLLRQQPI